MMVQSSAQTPGSSPEVASYPRLESDDGYDDAYWFKENPNRAVGMEISRTETTCSEYCPYINGISVNNWAVSNRPAVEAIVFRSPDRLVRDTRDKDTTWISLTYFSFHNCQVWWIVMSSFKIVPYSDRPRAVDTDSTQPPETFLRQVLESHFDKLYDLPENIQDVMGLQAFRPSAVVCKVMTVPNSRCVRIVTPDEHVSTGFHEILVNDMGQEDWPQVTLSDIGCLRLDWPKYLFAFVGRYQCELDQMKNACSDRFGPTASGPCPTCDKYIKVSLGKHVALYYLDLSSGAVMALPGPLVHSLEGGITRLCGPHE